MSHRDYSAMFGTNGFCKVSERQLQVPALGGLQRVRSDPVLPRLQGQKRLMLEAEPEVRERREKVEALPALDDQRGAGLHRDVAQ